MAESGSPDDFLTRLGVSETLRAILNRSAAEFERSDKWVSFDDLAYEAVEQGAPFDLTEIFKLPSILGGVWSGETVSLTGLGLLMSTTAPRTTALMASLAQICAERKMRLRDEATIGRDVLVNEYAFGEDDAIRAGDAIRMIPGLSGSGGLGEHWDLSIHRTALEFLDVHSVDDLRHKLVAQAEDQIRQHRQAMATAPAFFQPIDLPQVVAGPAGPEGEGGLPEPDDPSAVFVVHGRDREARDALWEFLQALGLHPLDWEDDLVAHTGHGSPFIGQILDAAFARAQAVVVLMTPDDAVRLHPDLVQPGEQAFESEVMCQPRPNVLFEAGMAFGYRPTRTIIVEVGMLRPVSDLGGRHTLRLGTEETLRGLARRLEVAGCRIDRSSDAWLDVSRFTNLAARSRHS